METIETHIIGRIEKTPDLFMQWNSQYNNENKYITTTHNNVDDSQKLMLSSRNQKQIYIS